MSREDCRAESKPRRGWRRYTLNQDFFSVIDTNEKAWVLGFIQADGTVTDELVAIRLATRDRSVLPKIAAVMGSNAPVYDDTYLADGSPRYRSNLIMCSRSMVADLIRQGVTPRKSFTAKPCPIEERFFPAYFRGLWDGDGWLFRDAGIWTGGFCGTLAVVRAFSRFIREKTGKRGKPYRSGRIWSVRYNGIEFLRKMADALWRDATIFLDRKQSEIETLRAYVPMLQDRSWITTAYLREARSRLPSWRAVAKELGMREAHLVRLRHRLGTKSIRPYETRDWTTVTPEEVQRLYQEKGTWDEVAKSLGIRTRSGIHYLRHRLGLLAG